MKKNISKKYNIFCPRRFQTARDKDLKTAREAKCAREKIAKFQKRKNNPKTNNKNVFSQIKKYLKILLSER